MPNYFPLPSNYPVSIDTDRTLYLVYNTAESIVTEGIASGREDMPVSHVSGDWGENGFANIGGELFYYDGVERDNNGLIVKFIRCLRGLSGNTPVYQPTGTPIRGYVVAQHHNRLSEAIIKTERFVGITESSDETTLDYRIRHLQETPIIVDDYSCPQLDFTVIVLEEDPLTGTLIRYDIAIEGNYNSFILNFGDGNSTRSVVSGTYRYPPNALNIDPVIIVGNQQCEIVQSPVTRTETTIPNTDVINEQVINLPVLTCPTLDDIIIPSINIPSLDIIIPPIIVPDFGIGSLSFPLIGDISLPSFIQFSDISIPSFIEFGDIDIPSFITFDPAISLPSMIMFDPAISLPSFIGFSDISIPELITFSPEINIPSFVEFSSDINIPSFIEFGEVPVFSPIEFDDIPPLGPIEFADAPTFTPVGFDTPPAFPNLGYDPPPAFPNLGYDPPPAFPDLGYDPPPAFPDIGFDPPPAFPDIGFDPAPVITVNWGQVPTIPIYVAVTCGCCSSCPSGGSSTGGGSSMGFADFQMEEPQAFGDQGFNDEEFFQNENNSIDIEPVLLGIPSVIDVKFPEIPDLRVVHDIPKEIIMTAPSEIPLVYKGPEEIRLAPPIEPIPVRFEPITLPIELIGTPNHMQLIAPDSFPSLDININVTGIPDVIKVDMPDSIKLDAPESIKLDVSEPLKLQLMPPTESMEVTLSMNLHKKILDKIKSDIKYFALIPREEIEDAIKET